MRTKSTVMMAWVLTSLIIWPPPVNAAGDIGHDGPFIGVVTDDDNERHHFDNHGVLPRACYQANWVFRVTLQYQPASDKLTLRVRDREETGENGYAEVLVDENDSCARFAIDVTGTEVTNAAAYVVEVEG